MKAVTPKALNWAGVGDEQRHQPEHAQRQRQQHQVKEEAPRAPVTANQAVGRCQFVEQDEAIDRDDQRGQNEIAGRLAENGQAEDCSLDRFFRSTACNASPHTKANSTASAAVTATRGPIARKILKASRQAWVAT